MKFVERLDDRLAKVESWLIVLFLSTMILLSFSQVILRNFFDQGILWADILLRQLVLWVGFFGASLAVRENKHISISFFPNFISSRWKPILSLAVNAVSALVSALLAYAAWSFVHFEYEGGAKLFLNIPVWVFQSILPYAFAVISLRYFLKVFSRRTSANS